MANQFVEQHFQDRVPHHKRLLQATEELLEGIDEPLDKIKIINNILDNTNSFFQKHQLECKSPEECDQPYHQGMVVYHLTQKLNRLGVQLNDDTFSVEEKMDTESKLEKILEDLNNIKLGQEVIYEDLTNEINNLKELYFLGKKNWHQLLIGKCIEMVASGIVSETVSKQIISEFKNNIPGLLTV